MTIISTSCHVLPVYLWKHFFNQSEVAQQLVLLRAYFYEEQPVHHRECVIVAI